jgi:hypothetical protein
MPVEGRLSNADSRTNIEVTINRQSVKQVIVWSSENAATTRMQHQPQPVIAGLLHGPEDAYLNEYNLSATLERRRRAVPVRVSNLQPKTVRQPAADRSGEPQQEQRGRDKEESVRQAREEAKKALKRKFAKKKRAP